MGANRLPGMTKRQKERRRAERKQAKAERLAQRRARKQSEREDSSPNPVRRGDGKLIKDGVTVSIEYTLKLDDGTTVDTNVEGDPLTFVQGSGQILPALEEQLDGLDVNESKQVTLPPEKAYGDVKKDAFQTIPLERIPEDARQVDARLVAQDDKGNKLQLRVHEINGDQAVLNLNHPLAGKTLHFDVKVLAVQ